jgi:ABC-type Mn2+/Zn2+ transport system permease subunit
VTTAGFAVGLALFSLYGHARRNLDALLFGSILGVGMSDVWVVSAVAAASAVVVALTYRPLLFVTFDAEVAEISGIRAAWIDALLMLLLASTILVTMQILGVTLVAAGLVIPPATARLLTDSFTRMLWLSTILGAATAAVGMLAGYHYEVPPGAAIVLVGTVVFALAYGLRRLTTHH